MEKYKNTLVKFFDELMKGIPDNMFDKKMKLGDESMELSKWFSKKDGQGRPWLTIPDEKNIRAIEMLNLQKDGTYLRGTSQ